METTEQQIREWNEIYQNSTTAERMLKHLGRLHDLFKGHVFVSGSKDLDCECKIIINNLELFNAFRDTGEAGGFSSEKTDKT